MEVTKKPAPVFEKRVFEEYDIPSTLLEEPSKDILKNVFIPTWDNRPALKPPVLRLGSTTISTHQNTTALIANPGGGKSSAMEAIGASFLNPDSDNLGFEVDPKCRGVIIIDNERTNQDVWNSHYRMCKRAGIPEGQPTNNVVIAGLRSVARLPERIKTIEHLLQNNPCSLLLIDGAGDLVNDTNDLKEAIECRIWLREITVKYDLSILVTLHPNPNSNKPRGHQGSEICREAECVLLAKPYDEHTRIITSDFEQGKNRNNPKLTTAYRWSDESKMFISADYEDLLAGKKDAKDAAKRSKAEILAKQILPAQTALKNGDLLNAIMNKTSQSESTAVRVIREMVAWQIVTKYDDGYYRKNNA